MKNLKIAVFLAVALLTILLEATGAFAQDQPTSPLPQPITQPASIDVTLVTTYSIDSPARVQIFPGSLSTDYKITLIKHGPEVVTNATYSITTDDDELHVDAFCSYNADKTTAYCSSFLAQDRLDVSVTITPYLDSSVRHYWNDGKYSLTYVENNIVSVYRVWLSALSR